MVWFFSSSLAAAAPPRPVLYNIHAGGILGLTLRATVSVFVCLCVVSSLIYTRNLGVVSRHQPKVTGREVGEERKDGQKNKKGINTSLCRRWLPKKRKKKTRTNSHERRKKKRKQQQKKTSTAVCFLRFFRYSPGKNKIKSKTIINTRVLACCYYQE